MWDILTSQSNNNNILSVYQKACWSNGRIPIHNIIKKIKNLSKQESERTLQWKLNLWRRRETLEYWVIFHAQELVELILWKQPFYQKK